VFIIPTGNSIKILAGFLKRKSTHQTFQQNEDVKFGFAMEIACFFEYLIKKGATLDIFQLSRLAPYQFTVNSEPRTSSIHRKICQFPGSRFLLAGKLRIV